MRRAIIIHGWSHFESWKNPDRPSPSNAAFIPWLSKQLIINNIHAVAIEMPNSYSPNYEIWKKELDRFKPDEDTILIGWSCGGGFLVRYLSEKNIQIKKLILPSPWIGTFTDNEKHNFDESFFEFEVDEELSKKTSEGVVLLEAKEESEDILKSLDILKGKLKNANHRVVEKSGKHFHEVEQKEVLEEILRSKNDNFSKLA